VTDTRGAARGPQPNGVQEKPPKKDANGPDARKTETAAPPADVIAEAIKHYQSDTRGRWHVGNYLPSGRRRAHSFDISHAEVRRLLWRLWPKRAFAFQLFLLALTSIFFTTRLMQLT
jgi:hypothetical protein